MARFKNCRKCGNENWSPPALKIVYFPSKFGIQNKPMEIELQKELRLCMSCYPSDDRVALQFAIFFEKNVAQKAPGFIWAQARVYWKGGGQVEVERLILPREDA